MVFSVSQRFFRAATPVRAHTLVLVESPAKAKKVQKFLGDEEFTVLASYGHIRDLPSKTGAVLPEQDFKMEWEVSSRGATQLRAVEKAIRSGSDSCERVVLATDPDREGEAIAWHLLQELKERGLLGERQVERVTFTEVTQNAVLDAFAQPRDISQELVDAYLARRALDYLVGFSISPVLWRKMSGARSAGRVQSVALRLVCDREAAREVFVPKEYWTLEVQLETPTGARLAASLTRWNGAKVGKQDIKGEREAREALAAVRAAGLSVGKVTRREKKSRPPPPYTTSTMQQDSSNKLGFDSSMTMSLAQRLYEGDEASEGHITYMRTDGVFIAESAVSALRDEVEAQFGAACVPAEPRVYKSKSKNSQEAHEAIRPTRPQAVPLQMASTLDAQQHKLYSMIWSRTMACQMIDALYQQYGVDAIAGDNSVQLRSTAQELEVPGWLAAWGRESDIPSDPSASTDSDAEESAPASALRELVVGDQLKVVSADCTQHFTKPPPRYTEASLVAAMEELGIGRPSTYAPILRLLRDRAYVEKNGKSLSPSPVGRVLTAFLEAYFGEYVDYGFTSAMEEKLDEVSAGREGWSDLLEGFWGPFQEQVSGATGIPVTDVIDRLDEALAPYLFPAREDGADPRQCPACESGRLGFKPSRTGGFVGCSNYSAEDPAHKCTYGATLEAVVAAAADPELGLPPPLPREGLKLGVHPATGADVNVCIGPYGPFVQTPDPSSTAAREGDAGAAPLRRASLPAGARPDEVTLDDALELLRYPLPLGVHADTGLPVEIATGRFGPYVRHGSLNAAIPKRIEDPASLDLDAALALLSAKAARKKMDPIAAALAPPKGKGRRGKAKGTTAVEKKKAAAEILKRRKKEAAKAGVKAPVSAWLHFCADNRAAVVAKNPTMGLGSVTKALAEDWKALGDDQRAAYEACAVADKERYAAEFAAWEAANPAEASASSDSPADSGSRLGSEAAQEPPATAKKLPRRPPAAKKARSATKKAATRRTGVSVGKKKAMRKATTKKAVDNGGVKKPRSAYILFCKERRPDAVAAHPGAALSEITKIIAADWREADPQTRERFEAAAAEDKARYEQEVAATREPTPV